MGKWAQYRHRGRSTAVSPHGETPPEGDACYNVEDATHASIEFTLTGGYPPGEHFITVEGQDTILLDSGFGTGASDAGTITTDPFPWVNGHSVRFRAAFSNSDGSVLHSAWSAFEVIDQC